MSRCRPGSGAAPDRARRESIPARALSFFRRSVLNMRLGAAFIRLRDGRVATSPAHVNVMRPSSMPGVLVAQTG